MKKKFLLGTMVPALAAAAVIGSGFSLWVFDALTKTNDAQAMEKTITQFAQIGEIKEASKLLLLIKLLMEEKQQLEINQFQQNMQKVLLFLMQMKQKQQFILHQQMMD